MGSKWCSLIWFWRSLTKKDCVESAKWDRHVFLSLLLIVFGRFFMDPNQDSGKKVWSGKNPDPKHCIKDRLRNTAFQIYCIVFRALRVSYCKAAFELSPSREFLSSSFPFLFKQNRRKIDILPGILIFILVIPFSEFDTVFTVGYADLNRRWLGMRS